MQSAANLLKPISLCIGIACATVLGVQTSQASTPFDGKWKVTVSAKGEDCSTRYAVPIRIAQGQVSYSGLFRAKASGKVAQNGALKVSFAHRKSIVSASGMLNGETGRGRWTSLTKDCSGTWIARKA